VAAPRACSPSSSRSANANSARIRSSAAFARKPPGFRAPLFICNPSRISASAAVRRRSISVHASSRQSRRPHPLGPDHYAAPAKNPELRDINSDQQMHGLQVPSSSTATPPAVLASLFRTLTTLSAMPSASARSPTSTKPKSVPRRAGSRSRTSAKPGCAQVNLCVLQIRQARSAQCLRPLRAHEYRTLRQPPGHLPAITLSFNLAPGASLGPAVDHIEQARRELGVPGTVHATFQGTAQAFQDSLSNQPILILTALAAVYIVLGILYEASFIPSRSSPRFLLLESARSSRSSSSSPI